MKLRHQNENLVLPGAEESKCHSNAHSGKPGLSSSSSNPNVIRLSTDDQVYGEQDDATGSSLGLYGSNTFSVVVSQLSCQKE